MPPTRSDRMIERPRLVFKYHCEPQTADDEAALCDQLRLVNEYRRELALIENRGRALRRSTSTRLTLASRKELAAVQRDPDAKIIKNQLLESLVTSLAPGTDREAMIADVSDGLSGLGLSTETVRHVVDARLVSDAENNARLALRKQLSARGLSWGTYQAADEAHDASCRTTAALDDIRIPPRGTVGCVAAHLQPARLLREDDPWIRIGGIVRRGSEIDKSGRVRPARHRDVAIRVGTLADRSPRFARLFVLMHREIPIGWEVSWAKIQRFQIGPVYRWELCITAQATEGAATRPDPANGQPRSAASGVDIGWRRVDGGIRIARWSGTDGRSGEAVIPDRVLEADTKSDDLRAIRDRMKNAEKEALLIFLLRLRVDREAKADESCAASDWFVEATQTMHLWLRTSRFVRLVHQWSEQRFPGDEIAHDRVQAWLRQDRHLWSWEAFNRAKRQRRVDAIIRGLAVQLGREYERIGIEAPFVGRIVKKPGRCVACRDASKRCDDCMKDERLRRLASTRIPHAAPARTRSEIQVFGVSNGARVVECDPAYTTRTCSGCGYLRDDVADWSALVVSCSRCGLAEDQDLTAALNLARLASAAVPSEDGTLLASGNRAKSSVSKKDLGARRTRKVAKARPLETG